MIGQSSTPATKNKAYVACQAGRSSQGRILTLANSLANSLARFSPRFSCGILLQESLADSPTGFSCWIRLLICSVDSCWILLLDSLAGFSCWICSLNLLAGFPCWICSMILALFLLQESLTGFACWICALDLLSDSLADSLAGFFL